MTPDVNQTTIGAVPIQHGPRAEVLGIAVGQNGERRFPAVLLDASGLPQLRRLPVLPELPDDPSEWPIRSRVTPALRQHGLKIQVEIAEPERFAFWFYLCPCMGPAFKSLITWMGVSGMIVVTGLNVAERIALDVLPDRSLDTPGGLVLPVDLGGVLALADQLARECRFN